MKYINELREGNRISGIYLCKHKQSAVTKNGKQYENVILQDKTGTIDAKIWDPNSMGIREFEALDYVDIMGDVSSFNGALQVSIKNARKAEEGEYNPADYLPTSRYDINTMYQELLSWIGTVKNQYLSELLTYYFIQDQETAKRFRMSSAAKSVHHGFVGGLLEHTLSVTRFCDFMVKSYPILNRDLLITAAILHDIGKTKELSLFPQNRCGDGTRCGAEDRRFPTGTRESVKALHSGAPRRAGIRFPEKTGNGRGGSAEPGGQCRCQNGNPDRAV